MDEIRARGRAEGCEAHDSCLRSDVARLLNALDAVTALHRAAKIYDECECPDGTHREDYDFIDCADYAGCENSLIGIGCEECCVQGDGLSEDCGENHTHTMDAAKRCQTMEALSAALGGDL